MKTLRLTTFIFAIAIMAFSCSDHDKDRKTNSKSDSRESLTDKAWKLRNDGAPSDQYINLQKSAVAQLRHGESADDAVKVLEQMGLFYQIVGDYTNALLYYQEAVDSLAYLPIEDRNEGTIQLYGDLSSLYRLAGMQKEALAYSDSALAESRRQGGVMSSDIYVMRAIIFGEMGERDSVSHCYDLGVNAVRTGRTNANKEYLESYVNAERAYYLLETYPDRPDSVESAVKFLRRRLEFDNADNTPYILSLGEGLCLQGNFKEGLQMMEEATEEIADQEDFEVLAYAYRELMQQYERAGMGSKMLALYPKYQEMQDSLHDMKKADYIIGASIRYETEKKNLEIDMLANKLALKKIQVTSAILTSILIAIILVGAIILFAKRYKQEHRRRREAQMQREILQKSHDDNLKRTQILEQDLSLKRNNNNELLATPQLITNELQGKFCRAFDALYPDVIPSIKKRHPDITPNDEIVCMLIYLKHTSDEIATFLGISRQSVNTTRYRLRKKLHLEENVKLDSYIQSFSNDQI